MNKLQLQLQITQRNKTTPKGNLTVVQATKHWTTVGDTLASDPAQLQHPKETCKPVGLLARMPSRKISN